MSTDTGKILVRGVNWLGDAVMSTPALLRLREARPDAEIVLLTPAKLAGLWAGHPAINRVLTFADGEGVWTVARRVRDEQFGSALILPNSPRSALEAFLARVPIRIGYARPWRSWLLTRPLPPRVEEVRMHKRSASEVRALVRAAEAGLGAGASPGARATTSAAARAPEGSHHLYQYLHLAAALGASGEATTPHVAVSADEVEAIHRRFGRAAPRQNGRRLIGINPGAEYGAAKRWPRERFVATAIEVSRRLTCDFWVLGGPAERELAEVVVDGIRAGAPPESEVRCLAGETSLRELCAALKACAVVLTNDTGPMHVAAAVGTRVVVPFGSTSWRLTGPGLPGEPRHRFLEASVPCAPCFRRECPIDFRCMTGLSVERVAHAVTEMFADA